MKVKYVLNNAMMGSRFKSLPQDKVISKNRIDPYHTEVILELVNQKQLDNINRMLFGAYAKGRYKILEEKLTSEATTSQLESSDLYHFMFADKIKYLYDQMQKENPWGIIPDKGDFTNPGLEKIVKAIFGSYEDEAARIFNIIIMNMGYDPAKLVEEENINSAEEFVTVLSDVLSGMGYN